MINQITSVFKNLWFRDTQEEKIYINDVAVRIRAGILLIIPVYMLYTLISVVFGPVWTVVPSTPAVDTMDTDWDGHIIYQVEATRRFYDYTIQTWVLIYGLAEMLMSMFVTTSRFSPTILIASFLSVNKKPVWKPLVPKRFAWSLGASFIAVCIVFFNPDVFANWINSAIGTDIPTTYNYMPYWIPLVLVWVCLGFMWLEAILGFCVGCKIHALLVKVGLLEEECEACNNIDWDEIARKNEERLAKQAQEQQSSSN